MEYMVSVKETKNLSIDKNVHDFLNPDYVYIPIYSGDHLLVKENEYVNKEQAIIKRNDNFIYSSVSGRIITKENNMNIYNTNIECLVIENDFREHVNKRNGAIKYINKYKTEEFLKEIKKYNIVKADFTKEVKTILVSGIDIDPFEKTNSFILNSYSDKILETMDALSDILNVDNIIIALSNGDTENVLNVNNNIGTYPNLKLKLVTSNYPIGFKEILIRNVLSSKEINDGVLYLSVYDIYNIYNVLRRKKPVTERYITVSGDCISQPIVVNAKIGASMLELINTTCKVTNDKYYVVINGLISGKTLNSLNTVITSDIRSIFLTTKDSISEKKCINCGLCNKECPMGLNPKYIKEHKNVDVSRCIGCGLCSYVCPSKINFKPYVGGRVDE